jgi:hypothetical protein
MKIRNLMYILFVILLQGCLDQNVAIEELLQKDHLLAERTLKLDTAKLDSMGLNHEIAEITMDRMRLISEFENRNNGSDEELAHVIAFLKKENDYCSVRYDHAIAIQQAKFAPVERTGVRKSQGADSVSTEFAQKSMKIRNDLKLAESELQKFHWAPVWASITIAMLSGNEKLN